MRIFLIPFIAFCSVAQPRSIDCFSPISGSGEPDFSTLGNSQSVVYQAAKAIDVSAYREANLIVRVHSYNVSGSGTSITVNVYPEAPTDEDPATDFIGTSTVATTGTIAQTNTFPYLNVQSVSTPFGGWLRIKLTGTQGGTASTTFSVTISIDIVAKS